MRRLLAICSAVGLLCGALGCHHCDEAWEARYHGHVHGRCDCDNGPAWGCHFDCYDHSHCHGGGPELAPVGPPPPHPELIPEPPKVQPK